MKDFDIEPSFWAFKGCRASTSLLLGRVKENHLTPSLQPQQAPAVFETLEGSDIHRQGPDQESL